jgi:hypothetical protein
MELACNFKHVAIAGAANSLKSEVLLAAIQEARRRPPAGRAAHEAVA